MAAHEGMLFSSSVSDLIKTSRILVVGAGGIGCELLKNLVLSGFKNIEVIDLDTIDVSNLNRQFLFRKEHVGKSKSQVARESVLKFNPSANIIAHHDSIISAKYGVNFVSEFSVVLNALDNRAARNQVNRVCLAAGVPLIESGTSGYLGQVELILKGSTKCYECDPKVPAKTYPGCTIRNTPSEHVHCIVWSKHLFNQLFGQADEDEDVSPDTSDPDAGVNGENDVKWRDKKDGSGDVERVSTRKWAKSVSYDCEKIFNKLFYDDINYLLSMENLWKSRKPPQPVNWQQIDTIVDGCSSSKEGEKGKDERIWTMAECREVFADSIDGLSKRFDAEGDLTWDKDDKLSMDFVTACANIRAHLFNIKKKSRFESKSIAGNIIPAIATANAIIAGLVVVQTLKVLSQKFESCQSVYLRKLVNHRGQLVVPEKYLSKPNPNCAVCSPMPQVKLCVDLNTMTCREFDTLVLKNHLNLPAPDVMLTSQSNIIVSSEEGETEHNNDKTLKELGITDGSILDVDDFIQNYQLKIIVSQRDKPKDPEEPLFLILGKVDDVEQRQQTNGDSKEIGSASSSMERSKDESDDDMEIIEEEVIGERKKRKIEEEMVPVKKRRQFVSQGGSASDDDLTIID